MPDKSAELFQRELEIVESAAFATSLGFVDARVVEPSLELTRALPRGIKAVPRVILMPVLSGGCAVDTDLARLDPHIISTTVIDWHCRLIDRGWYHTDCKLDTLWVLSSGEIRFTDWSSLCPAVRDDPIFTYYLEGCMTSPHACMSINLVVMLAELFGGKAPTTSSVAYAEYVDLREMVLDQLRQPARARLAKILVVPSH